MRRVLLAACAAAASFAASPVLLASPALAECCLSALAAIHGPPILPPTGYVLDPSDAYPPAYPVTIVDQGPLLFEPFVVVPAVPTYSEGGYAYRARTPYVRSYGGDRWFTAPLPRRFGWRARESGEGGPRIVRGGYGRGNFVPPYAAYHYRAAPSARIIHVHQNLRQDLPPK